MAKRLHAFVPEVAKMYGGEGPLVCWKGYLEFVLIPKSKWLVE